jgi:hypothetical protein
MAVQQTTVRILKSTAGAVLVGLGVFILYANMARPLAQLRHILANGPATLGGLPAAIFVLMQTVHAHVLDHQRFVEGLFRHVLVSSLWPLLLVIFGTVLSKDTFAESSDQAQEDNGEAIDVSSRAKHK